VTKRGFHLCLDQSFLPRSALLQNHPTIDCFTTRYLDSPCHTTSTPHALQRHHTLFNLSTPFQPTTNSPTRPSPSLDVSFHQTPSYPSGILSTSQDRQILITRPSRPSQPTPYFQPDHPYRTFVKAGRPPFLIHTLRTNHLVSAVPSLHLVHSVYAILVNPAVPFRVPDVIDNYCFTLGLRKGLS
jgi:hypothetical protein